MAMGPMQPAGHHPRQAAVASSGGVGSGPHRSACMQKCSSWSAQWAHAIELSLPRRRRTWKAVPARTGAFSFPYTFWASGKGGTLLVLGEEHGNVSFVGKPML